MVQDTGGDAPEGNAQAGDAPVPAAAPGLGAGSAAAAHTGVVPAGPARGGLGALRSLVHSLAWLLGLAVALLLLAVLVWRGAGWWVDWRGPTPAQQAALALINAQDLALPGPDGFADLWLLDKDVPPEQRAAWLAQDVAWFKQQHLFAPLAGLPSKQLPDLPLGAEVKGVLRSMVRFPLNSRKLNFYTAEKSFRRLVGKRRQLAKSTRKKMRR